VHQHEVMQNELSRRRLSKDRVSQDKYTRPKTLLQCVSNKTSPTFLAVTQEKIVGFS